MVGRTGGGGALGTETEGLILYCGMGPGGPSRMGRRGRVLVRSLLTTDAVFRRRFPAAGRSLLASPPPAAAAEGEGCGVEEGDERAAGGDWGEGLRA